MKKNLTGNQIRQMFLDFFKSKGFMIEPSASLIPHNDPTLLWINAGVSTLKKYFDGTEKPACPRIANAQKCIRTNDNENVGRTARPHTFFEMLGNFSIGDYFKKEAIPWAWEFLTSEEWIGMDKERLYVTVYPDDQEAYDLWVQAGMIESHISRNKDNFWEIGRGPGGPDSELYYDRGEKYDPEGIGEKLFFDDMENDRYVELWNIVFSQYDCRPGEMPRTEYKELPQKNIDTGMGLERLVCFLQEGETNFDTDLFLPIIHATEKYAKHSYDEAEYKMAYRVIADHIRTVTFALADGAMFSNEGRGYVLRRVLRRAVRYGIKLGIEGSFMYNLVQVCADNMKDYYGYVEDKVALVGANEHAKTVLFKILAGEMEPDEGSYKWGVTTSQSYFPKDNTAEFDCDLTIADWLTQYSEIKDVTYVRGFLGRMLFAGEDGVKRVRVLSGGEKVRCLLSKMMISGANVLVLDEPTNHLDMESITALNNGLIKFPGVLLFTCHDHQFVQTTANRIMEILPNGALIDKMTTYDEYLASDEMARKRHVYTMTEEDN